MIILLQENRNNSSCDYSVVYYTSDEECDRHFVGDDSCQNNICTDFLNVTVSPCLNASEISVNVTSSDYCDIDFTGFSDTTRGIIIVNFKVQCLLSSYKNH